jgi:uncharacterized membrane protein
MIVSLEAIFLSTFVMISQNRAAGRQQVIADEEWKTVQEEDQQNRQLLNLSNQILALTKEVHAFAEQQRRPKCWSLSSRSIRILGRRGRVGMSLPASLRAGMHNDLCD